MPFLVCFKTNLDPKIVSSFPEYSHSSNNAVHTDGPFCCHGNCLVKYKERCTQCDSYFGHLLSGVGHHPDVVFEVKKQVNNGPMISTTYWQLLDNNIVQYTESQPTQKKHAFKNYICRSHNLFYGVDLFYSSSSSGYNTHHMRLVPYTKINDDVLRSFFDKM